MNHMKNKRLKKIQMTLIHHEDLVLIQALLVNKVKGSLNSMKMTKLQRSVARSLPLPVEALKWQTSKQALDPTSSCVNSSLQLISTTAKRKEIREKKKNKGNQNLRLQRTKSARKRFQLQSKKDNNKIRVVNIVHLRFKMMVALSNQRISNVKLSPRKRLLMLEVIGKLSTRKRQ